MESLGYILAVIVALAVVLVPIALVVLFIIWLFKKVLGPKEQKPKLEVHKSPYNAGPYNTGWTWNENTKLWEPPADLKSNVSNFPPIEDTTYHFSKGELPREEPQQQTVFHHEDTSFTAHQKPKEAPAAPKTATTYRFNKASIKQDDIPHEDWRTINDSHRAETKPVEPVAATGDRYVMPTAARIQGYKSKYLLTPNEWHEHKKLRDYAAKKGLYVCPKVRLLDLVTPYGNGKDYMTRFHKVQAKHVDFVLVDDRMHIKAIVELDDSTHDAKDRQERDQFVDEVLSGVGYTVIHTRCITENTLSRL